MIASELWTPDTVDTYKATEAYIRYAAGVAMLSNPGVYERATDNAASNHPEEVIGFALGWLTQGIDGVIRHANPPELRDSKSKIESRFDNAVIHMAATVERAYKTEPRRLRKLSPMLDIVRPKAMLDYGTYASFCHGRYGRIKVVRLMDGLWPDESLSESLQDRTLTPITKVH